MSHYARAKHVARKITHLTSRLSRFFCSLNLASVLAILVVAGIHYCLFITAIWAGMKYPESQVIAAILSLPVLICLPLLLVVDAVLPWMTTHSEFGMFVLASNSLAWGCLALAAVRRLKRWIE